MGRQEAEQQSIARKKAEVVRSERKEALRLERLSEQRKMSERIREEDELKEAQLNCEQEARRLESVAVELEEREMRIAAMERHLSEKKGKGKIGVEESEVIIIGSEANGAESAEIGT